MMKKYLLLLLLMVAGSAAVSAQCRKGPDPKMWKEIQEFKLKFLSQEMDLSKDQEQKFFDLYNEMSEKKKAIFDEMRTVQNSLDKNKNADDKDYEEASKKLDALRDKDVALNKEYDKKFEKILTKRQIYKMKAAEDKFRHKMQQMRYKGKRHKDASKSKPAKK
ncbi:MAG: hypothetical protein K2H86_04570 [Muribaculaceae bacterium]|nr:hypothetical protein [Muribaculaceae bacterium]